MSFFDETFRSLKARVRATVYRPLIQERAGLDAPEAQQLIGRRILSGAPLMVARFGNTELRVMKQFHKKERFPLAYRLLALLSRADPPWLGRKDARAIQINAGFFPLNAATADRFCRLMIDSSRDVDLLGSWVPGENLFAGELENAEVCRLSDILPFDSDAPWSKALAGRKVLVIHPFADTIEKQYRENRARLFDNPDILPEFELLTLRAVQSAAGSKPEFATWFDALDHMYEAAMRMEFDTAIIGCGAYGFPLASMIKRTGKQAIHLGGATQLMFGIKGRRWDKDCTGKRLYNEYWTRPSADETPPGYKQIEGGTYW